MTLIANSTLVIDSVGARGVSGDDWTGISNQRRRKQLQNRLNQRAYKERLRQAKLARAFSQSDRPHYLVISQPEDGGLRSLPPWKLPETWCPEYPLNGHPDILVDPVVREVILFARDTLWPNFSSSRKYPGSDPSLNETWFHRILNVPIMRNAVISGTCLDLELLTGRRYSSTISKTIIELSREVRRLVSQLSLANHGDIGVGQKRPRPSQPPVVKHGTISATALVEPGYVEDDLLFAVMHLVKASNINLPSRSIALSPLDTTAGTFGLFTPPVFLKRLQALHLWGRSCPYQIQGRESDPQTAQHLAALEYLVSLKGGLRNIKTPGFAEALHLFDVMECAKRLKRPKFELPEPSLQLLKHMQQLKKEPTRGAELCKFDSVLQSPSLLEILEDLCILCSWISVVLGSNNQHASAGTEDRSSMSMLSPEDLTTLRNLIEYRLLAFVPNQGNAIEVLAHTAAMLFMHGVVFPLPSRWPMEMLMKRLIDGFQARYQYLQHAFRDVEESGFLVWVLMMGAMATSDTDVEERSFFVERLSLLTGQIRVSNWAHMRTILGRYLWIECGCEAGGMAVWTMIGEYSMSEESVSFDSFLRSSIFGLGEARGAVH